MPDRTTLSPFTLNDGWPYVAFVHRAMSLGHRAGSVSDRFLTRGIVALRILEAA
jgi:hypothetical protein